jgi:O-acetyl-ADP-ribose deacetylase (regulator of RNase III)
MSRIHYIKGDATYPDACHGPKIIAHIVNDEGKWGKGFALALGKTFPPARIDYLKWHRDGPHFGLGKVKFSAPKDGPWIAHMVAQHSVQIVSRPLASPPIRYEALRLCLSIVCSAAKNCGRTVHMPRIGSGLAGGKWELIEPIINQTLCEKVVTVYVYDLQ